MRSVGWRARLRSARVIVAVLVALVVAAGIALATVNRTPHIRTSSQFVAGTPEGDTPVQLDTTLYLPPATPAPAVLLAHGFGGTKDSVAGTARALAQAGFVVLAYTARGFGRSGGDIHLDSLQYEVKDAADLVTWLAGRPQVRRVDGAPQIGVAGSSYGGALALMLAGTDSRIKAVAADITWNDLAAALFPNADGQVPGVFKKLWAGYLFEDGLSQSSPIPVRPGAARESLAPQQPSDVQCGRFDPTLCALYLDAARTGRPSPALLALLARSSPATVLGSIRAPTLLTQGQDDSLFPLGQADANARGIAASGTPVRVQWRLGGHDGGGSLADSTLVSWFGDAFAGRVHGRQPFRVEQQGAVISSEAGNAVPQMLTVSHYPGLDGENHRQVALAGPPQTIAAPPGGAPAAITAVPAIGAILGQFGGLSGQVSALSLLPGQVAGFVSAPLTRPVLVGGSSSVRIVVTAHDSTDATLFLGLRVVSAQGGAVLPANLVAPLYLSGLVPGEPTPVTVHLPAVVTDVSAGSRLAVTVATTDLSYELPANPRTYTVALAPGSTLSLATVAGTVTTSGQPWAWLIAGGAVALAILLGVWLLFGLRRRVLHSAPEYADVPVVITDLGKTYKDGYRAVDGVSFRVERGQVVGLLGPNGAGKTTTLRVLVGLITPTSGSVHVFGEPVVPGASVLARLGAFIEGPGFLPHLTGLDNLRLYWAASGRPEAEADLDTALQIAGLGESVHRRVRTYSHGMRQRLGIAQAMLGLPELLILDEPTNGLDPPQIAEMREVLRSYAATGRTVVVSSHLLAEVEQSCTHVVVMHKGRLVATGSVAEIAGGASMHLAVDDPQRAAQVLAGAGIAADLVPARRALEEVFLDLVEAE
ncbi:MAG: alpha/beta fold hydrolase [Jatrophihabitans sp.]|nr:MAG: alpha/beta fold hydrolase [Jatrophihabitans sp.]